MFSPKWWQICLGLNVLNQCDFVGKICCYTPQQNTINREPCALWLLMNYIVHFLLTKLYDIELRTVITRYFPFTHFDICRQQYVNVYLASVSYYFSNSRFQVRPRGMIRSQPLCGLCFTAIESKAQGITLNKNFRWMNVLQTDQTKIFRLVCRSQRELNVWVPYWRDTQLRYAYSYHQTWLRISTAFY